MQSESTLVAAAVLAGVLVLLALLGVIWRARKASKGRIDSRVLDILVASSAAPRLVTAGEGRVIAANPSARDWLGDLPPLELLSRDAARDYAGDEAVARLRQAAMTNLAAAAEVPLQGATDETEWFDVTVRPIGEGYLLWDAVDITARRTITDILNQERQDLADFLYLLPGGIYSVDVDGTFRFVNQRFADWLGYDVDELSAFKLDDIIAGSNRPQPDGEWQGEVHFKTRAGETITALLLQSTYDDAGVTRTRTLVVRDGMRREPPGASGRIAYERFRALFDAAPVAIAISDADGIIVDCNRAFEKLTEQPRAGLIGSPLLERVVDDDQRTFAGELDRVLTGESAGSHVDVRVSGAGVSQTSVFVGPMSAPGDTEIEGVVAHFIDVTEQKELEVQFAQAQKMQAMGQLAGGVAHDFNNLLTAMIGFCDLLLQRHGAGDPSVADIMQIKQNANRAANLVRQLRAFSRKQPLQPKDLNVTDALMELSHLLTRLIGESIEFKLIHGRDLGLVRVDPGQFDQMIINLAVNARDAMPGGGTLTITTGTEVFDQPTQLGAEQ
ncbi:MAG: PAS domain-containing protein, partial [Rhodospirillaceae bacterium]|nr:PAS domain-containing protein [Rhodospirillaceae bacterium]